MIMADRIIREIEDWALASDGVQWELLRRMGEKNWRAVSFVRSTRDILERCMREKGVGAAQARFMLDGLPDTYDQYKIAVSASEAKAEGGNTGSDAVEGT
jgi:hypothetical protein